VCATQTFFDDTYRLGKLREGISSSRRHDKFAIEGELSSKSQPLVSSLRAFDVCSV